MKLLIKKRKKVTFLIESLLDTTKISLSSNGTDHVFPVVFLPKTHNESKLKDTNKSQLQDSLQKNWPVLLYSIKVIREKEQRSHSGLNQTTKK